MSNKPPDRYGKTCPFKFSVTVWAIETCQRCWHLNMLHKLQSFDCFTIFPECIMPAIFLLWITQVICVKINLSPINFHSSAQTVISHLPDKGSAMEGHQVANLTSQRRLQHLFPLQYVHLAVFWIDFWQMINQTHFFSFQRALPWAHRAGVHFDSFGLKRNAVFLVLL